VRFPICGGNRNNGSNAGLAALNLNNVRSNTNSNIGFRPALEDRQKVQRLRLCTQCAFKRAPNPRPSAEI